MYHRVKRHSKFGVRDRVLCSVKFKWNWQTGTVFCITHYCHMRLASIQPNDCFRIDNAMQVFDFVKYQENLLRARSILSPTWLPKSRCQDPRNSTCRCRLISTYYVRETIRAWNITFPCFRCHVWYGQVSSMWNLSYKLLRIMRQSLATFVSTVSTDAYDSLPRI